VKKERIYAKEGKRDPDGWKRNWRNHIEKGRERSMDEEKTGIPDPLAEEPYLITTDRG
jgi:hypothetical protein